MLVPDCSEAILSIPDFYHGSVPAAVLGVPGALGPFDFTWPSFAEVTGLLVMPRDGLEATLASLSLEIFDELEKPIATDGRGLVLVRSQPFAVPCLEMFGRGFRPYAFSKRIRPHDRWRLTLKNSSAAAIIVSSLSLFVKDGAR